MNCTAISVVVRVANLCMRGLDTMYGFDVTAAGQGACAPQRAEQLRVLRKASRWCSQMDCHAPPRPDVAWAKLIHDDAGTGFASARPPLVAEQCDFIVRSGLVDPVPLVDSEAQHTLSMCYWSLGS